MAPYIYACIVVEFELVVSFADSLTYRICPDAGFDNFFFLLEKSKFNFYSRLNCTCVRTNSVNFQTACI